MGLWMVWEREEKKDNEEVNQIMKKKIAKERKVIPDPSCVNSFKEGDERNVLGI